MEAEKNKMLAQISMELSNVCILLSKEKQDDEKLIKGKIKIMKKHNPDDLNIEVMEKLMKRKKENYKKHAAKFKKKAKIFKALAKLHKVNLIGGKNGKK